MILLAYILNNKESINWAEKLLWSRSERDLIYPQIFLQSFYILESSYRDIGRFIYREKLKEQ